MTTQTAFNDLDLSDRPFNLELIVQQKTTWKRRLQIFDQKTRLVIPLAGKTFYGDIKETVGGAVIASYVFVPDIVNNWFDVSLTTASIDLLDVSRVYLHDWLYTEGSEVFKVMSGTIQAVTTYTTTP
jgi:hypothetical protein